MGSRVYRFWNREEDEVLKKLAGTMSAEKIGEHMNRTTTSIHCRIRTLGLKGHLHGEHHWASKVSSLQVAMVTTLSDAGFSLNEIHTMFTTRMDASKTTVNDIIAARTRRQG